MSGTLQQLNHRIKSAEDLLGVTRSMRALAAVNLGHYELAAEAIGGYEAIVEDGLHIVLRNGGIDRLPREQQRADSSTAIIVFGSNQGLCGSINRRVAARAAEEAANVASVSFVGAIGARLGAELDLVDMVPNIHWDLPGTVEGITPRASEVLDQAARWRSAHDQGRVLLVFPRFLGRHRPPEPVMLQLTPTDREWLEWLAIRRWPSRVLPTYSMPWDKLITDLIRQALFVRLHRSFAQTMASVSSSRLTAMDTAQRNIEQRLTRLHVQHHNLRHTQITEELLDVLSGFETIHRS